MILKYKYGYLTDGTKVKITEELFNQLKSWETQEIYIDNGFKDILKIQDNDWINSQRNFYLKLYKKGTEDSHTLLSSFLGKKDIEEICVFEKITTLLNMRTEVQKNSFIKYYFLGMSIEEIAKEEGRSIQAVYKSLQKVRIFLMENLDL